MAEDTKTAALLLAVADKPAAPAIAGGKFDGAIERWFAAAFHGSPHMRDTETFNHVRRKVDELKRLLAEEN
jgi:hypothetical protein